MAIHYSKDVRVFVNGSEVKVQRVEHHYFGVDHAVPGSERTVNIGRSGTFREPIYSAPAPGVKGRRERDLEEALQRVAARITARARENAKAPAVRGHRVTTPNAEALVRLAHLRRRIARQPQ